MRATVVMLHTVPLLVGEFSRLAAESVPECDILHVLDEPLLARIKRNGQVTQEDDDRVLGHVRLATDVGAAAVLVTCSSASESTSRIRARVRIPIIAIDDAMASEAVRLGPRIGLVATSRTTLGPSERLLRNAAKDAGREVSVTTRFVEDAMAALLRGDGDSHDRLVETAVRSLADDVDVIVLAQASMARTLRRLANEPMDLPVLASPTFALTELRQAILPVSPNAGHVRGVEPAS